MENWKRSVAFHCPFLRNVQKAPRCFQRKEEEEEELIDVDCIEDFQHILRHVLLLSEDLQSIFLKKKLSAVL